MILCPNCESKDVTVTRVEVDARRIGLPSGQLVGVERIVCSECEEVSINVPAHGGVVKEYRRQLAQVSRELTAEEFSYLRRSLGLSGKAYADALQVSNVTISRLENGNSIPSLQQSVVRALTLLDLASRDAVAAFAQKAVKEVQVDVAAVETRQVHDLSNGWQVLPKHLPSNVVIFPGMRKPARTVQVAEFSLGADESDESIACRR